MRLSHLSIKRPYFAFMINLAIIIFGLIAYKKLPIANNPNVDLPYVWAGVGYPNASPTTTEELILKPLENAVRGLSGIKNINGNALEGFASLFIEFELDVPANKAYEDVRTAVSALSFPDSAQTPQVLKIQMNSEPIFEISVSAPNLSLEELSTIIKESIQPKIQRVSGVSAVYLYGDSYREVQISLKQNTLRTLNISPLHVQRTIESQIFNRNTGKLKEPGQVFTLSVNSIPNSLDSIAKMPISIDSKNFIHLENVANIKETTADSSTYSGYNGIPSLTIAIYKDAQGNIVQTAKNIQKVLNAINAEYKNKIILSPVHDDSKFIKKFVNNVQFDILLGALFAILTVFIFLHEWKNTLICMIAIPTSLIGALALIQYLHFSLNMMTLFALTLCVGIVVDDAIVVIENIHRHRELGKSPWKAAMDGTDEIGFAAICVTLAIVSVFVPIAFMNGIIGRFFYEFGMTVVVAVLISLFVAFTAVPMFSSRIKDTTHNAEKKKHRFGVKFDQYFEKFQNFYLKLITRVLKFKKTTLFSAFIIFIASIVLLKFVPIMFTIESDQSSAKVNFTLQQNTSLSVAKVRGEEIEKYIKQLPGVKNILMKIGSGNHSATNTIKFNVFLVDKNERTFTDKEFLNYLTDGLKQFVRSPDESVGFSNRDYAVQVSLFSHNSDQLKKYGSKLATYINTLPDVKGAITSDEDPVIEYRIIPDNKKLSLLHVQATDLANTLQLLFNGSYIGKYNENGNYLDIKMMLPKDTHNSFADLNSIFIPTQTGSQVLLSNIAKIEKVPVDPSISHLNGDRVLTVKANYIGNDLSGMTKKIETYMFKTIPVDVSQKLSGQSNDVNEMFITIGPALILAVIFVFMILAIQFENIIAPMSILLSIPFAFSGAFLALLIARKPLSIESMIGIIMLMGLVTKNAILLIEFAQQRIQEGFNKEAALIEAARVRLRPIIMTTLTMIVGMLPMALNSGEGSEVSSNIAITVIGGLISSTILTLLIVPSVYLSFARKIK